jgi:hypothetical protein
MRFLRSTSRTVRAVVLEATRVAPATTYTLRLV